MPYTIILYPIIFIFMARLWSVSHRHGYVTTAGFVQGRYDSRVLSLAVAVTGFVKDALIYLVIIVAIITSPAPSTAAGTASSVPPRRRWLRPTKRPGCRGGDRHLGQRPTG